MFQLPWEHDEVKRVIEAFDCRVLAVETVDENNDEGVNNHEE